MWCSSACHAAGFETSDRNSRLPTVLATSGKVARGRPTCCMKSPCSAAHDDADSWHALLLASSPSAANALPRTRLGTRPTHIRNVFLVPRGPIEGDTCKLVIGLP